mmetsp:Transcript_66267/g.205033  ORF Transcript_66267/g.205033 Transcript_66267/m.205033 type:complete len:321 (-) Transcript_66267:454-1416(-)
MKHLGEPTAFDMSQLPDGTPLHNAALVEDNDCVEVQDRLQAVRDGHDRGVGKAGPNRVLHQLLGVGIDGGSALVQEQQLRVPQDLPRDAEELLLAEADVIPIRPDVEVQADTALRHKVRHLHGPEARPHLVVREDGERVQVVPESAGEEDRVLRHHAEAVPERQQAHRLQVDAVDVDLAGPGLQQAQEALNHGGLAASRRARDGRLGLGVDGDADALQHVVRVVRVPRDQVGAGHARAPREPAAADAEPDLGRRSVAQLLRHGCGVPCDAVHGVEAVPGVRAREGHVAGVEDPHVLAARGLEGLRVRHLLQQNLHLPGLS